MDLSRVCLEVLSPVESMTSQTVHNSDFNVAAREISSRKLKSWPFYTSLIETIRPPVPRNRDSSVRKPLRSADSISETSTGRLIECVLLSRELKFRFPYTLGGSRRLRSRYKRTKWPTHLRKAKLAGGKVSKANYEAGMALF